MVGELMKLDNVLEIKAKEYYDKCESIVKNKRTSQDEYDKLQKKVIIRDCIM